MLTKRRIFSILLLLVMLCSLLALPAFADEESADAAAEPAEETPVWDADTLTYEDAVALLDYADSLDDEAEAFLDENSDAIDRANFLISKHDISFYATFLSLLPPIIAIALALITKEVYSSLFVGILVGGFLYANFNPVAAVEHIFPEGMIAQLSDSWNVGILIFLVILGAMVILMTRAGGSAAFGKWAQTHIKSP